MENDRRTPTPALLPVRATWLLASFGLLFLAGCQLPGTEGSGHAAASQASANHGPGGSPAVAQYGLGVGAPETGAEKGPPAPRGGGGLHAVLETNKGTIEIEFYAADSPKAVENFRLLAQRGYYNGVTFHRIVRGFMIQGGDPTGLGTGGESAWGGMFDDDINPDSALYRQGYRRGVLAMANSGPNTNGSQFFIMLQDYPLPPSYVIFGKVIQGIEVVDALGATPTKPGPDGEVSQPITPQVMRKVTIVP
jgi:cyclophilin family peptidyl-prolyl cis-trans isomerase